MQAVRNETVAVTTASREIASDMESLKSKRSDLVIRNISTNAADIITIALGNVAAVANAGIVLRQQETLAISTDISNPCWQGAIQAICATINGNLSIMEK